MPEAARRNNMKFLDYITRNWKTTAAGIISIVSVFTPVPLWIGPVVAGIGLVLSRDADKSSEDTGIKK
jgi:hypothetical protein